MVKSADTGRMYGSGRHHYQWLFVPALILCLGAMAACGPLTTNALKQNYSIVEGKTRISMQPGFIYGADQAANRVVALMGMEWDERQEAVFRVTTILPDQLINIRIKDALKLTIDGVSHAFDARERATRLEYIKDDNVEYRASIKSFDLPLELLARLADAEEVSVLIETLEGPIEGVITSRNNRSAIYGIERLNAAVQKFLLERQIGPISE